MWLQLSSRRGAWSRAVLALSGLVSAAHAEAPARSKVAAKPGAVYAPSPAITEERAELAVYQDTDAVTVFTPALSGEVRHLSSGWSASGSYLIDIVSAASVDIVSTASPNWHEVRQAAAIDTTYRPGSLGAGVGASVSVEPDYLSYGAGLRGLAELARKRLTLELDATYSHDIAGLKDTPFSVYSLELDRYGASASAELVLDRATTFTPLLDVVYESGRQEKPYRYLPLFAASVVPSVPRGAPVDLVNTLRLPPKVAEHVPDQRTRLALSGRLAHRFEHSTLLVFERLYLDDWGLFATTTDSRFVIDLGERWSLWPHGRVHVQSGASFWRRAYVGSRDGLEVPNLRTGDRELGPLWSATLGPGVQWNLYEAAASALNALFELEGTYTNYQDALYIKQRWAGFASLQVEATFR